MSCPHATSTTLLWLYGEADEAHLHHVAHCEACAAVVAEHEQVAGLVAPVLPSVQHASKPPRRRPAWLLFSSTLALAAATLLMVRLSISPAPTPTVARVDTDSNVIAQTVSLPDWHSDLDANLDELDYALDSLNADLSTM